MTPPSDTQKRPRILITSPSLEESENVSGISTIVGQIIKHCNCDFFGFSAGSRDNEKAGPSWLMRQILLPLRFLGTILRHKVDAVHINTAFSPRAMVRDCALTMTARFVGRPVLLHLHGGRFLFEEIPGIFLKSITGEMLHLASRIVVLSEFEKEYLLRRWKGLKVEVLPNAVDVDEIGKREGPHGQRHVVFYGRIDRDKGLKEIVAACQTLASEGLEFTFTCYGAGPDAHSFAAEMNHAIGDRFKYRGVVSGPDKWRALKGADIFLLPSYFEGLPMSLLEAMAAGCLVVATDVGSVKTVVEDGVNGFLIGPGDEAALADRLRLLLLGTPDIAAIRDNARTTVEKHYSISNYVSRLDGIYKMVME